MDDQININKRQKDFYLPPITIPGKRHLSRGRISGKRRSSINTNQDNDHRVSEDNMYQQHQPGGRKTIDMFTRMSSEAREAYNEILKEMTTRENNSISSIDSNSNCRARLHSDSNRRDRGTTVSDSTSISTSPSSTRREPAIEHYQPKRPPFDHHWSKSFSLPKLTPRTYRPDSNSRRRKKRNSPFLTSTPLITNSKAPISHTAARIGRKNRTNSPDLYPMRESVEPMPMPNIIRPFEITPMGYDSRYVHLQPIADDKHYNTDEDDDLASYVINKATLKCKDWLQNQTDNN